MMGESLVDILRKTIPTISDINEKVQLINETYLQTTKYAEKEQIAKITLNEAGRLSDPYEAKYLYDLSLHYTTNKQTKEEVKKIIEQLNI